MTYRSVVQALPCRLYRVCGPCQNTFRCRINGTFDERMAVLVAKWRGDGHEIDLDGLLILTYLREHAYIDTKAASDLLQLPRDDARGALDRFSQPRTGFLERRGKTKAATYHLNKAVAKDLMGKAAYTKTKGVDPI